MRDDRTAPTPRGTRSEPGRVLPFASMARPRRVCSHDESERTKKGCRLCRRDTNRTQMRRYRDRQRLVGALPPLRHHRATREQTPSAERKAIPLPKRPRVKGFDEPTAAFWRQRYVGVVTAADDTRVTVLNLFGIQERLPRCDWLALLPQQHVDALLMRLGKTDLDVAV